MWQLELFNHQLELEYDEDDIDGAVRKMEREEATRDCISLPILPLAPIDPVRHGDIDE